MKWPHVHTVYRPERMGFDVYVQVGQDDIGKRYFRTPTDVIPVAPGEEAPRFMFVDSLLAEALAEALRPAPEVTARHLDDAIAVRDKVLDMVERIVDADLAREARR